MNIVIMNKISTSFENGKIFGTQYHQKSQDNKVKNAKKFYKSMKPKKGLFLLYYTQMDF